MNKIKTTIWTELKELGLDYKEALCFKSNWFLSATAYLIIIGECVMIWDMVKILGK